MARVIKFITSLDETLWLPGTYLETGGGSGGPSLLDSTLTLPSFLDDDSDPGNYIEDSRGGVALLYDVGVDLPVKDHGVSFSQTYRNITVKGRPRVATNVSAATDFIAEWLSLRNLANTSNGLHAQIKVEFGKTNAFKVGIAGTWSDEISVGAGTISTNSSSVWTLQIDTVTVPSAGNRNAYLYLDGTLLVGPVVIAYTAANIAHFGSYGGLEVGTSGLIGKGEIQLVCTYSWVCTYDDTAATVLHGPNHGTPTYPKVQARYPIADSGATNWTGTGDLFCGLYTTQDDPEDTFNVKPDYATAPSSGANEDMLFEVGDANAGVAVQAVAVSFIATKNQTNLQGIIVYNGTTTYFTLYQGARVGTTEAVYYFCANGPDGDGTPAWSESVFNHATTRFGIRQVGTPFDTECYGLIVHVFAEDTDFARLSALECVVATRRIFVT